MTGLTRPGVLAATVALAGVVASVGCGDAPPAGAVATADPAQTFAPLVVLDERERYRPMSADWFLDRAVLQFVEGPGLCPDRPIAVGRELAAQQNEVVDWMFKTGVGAGPAYWREAKDRGCEPRHGRVYANQLTRPHDVDVERVQGLEAGEGYVLDLMDWARRGPELPHTDGDRPARVAVPAYVERAREEVDGELGVRLSYHFLFGMSDAGGGAVHEGDWERIDVLLTDHDGSYRPRAVEVGDRRVDSVEVPWARVAKHPVGAMSATHPVVVARRGDHQLATVPPGAADELCEACPRWPLWADLRPAARQDWYGFGGAWGEAGASDQTTGPLGPHGDWAAGNPADDVRRAERHEAARSADG